MKTFDSKIKLLKFSYDQAKYNHEARYIHKYYVHKDLKNRIILADIVAIMQEMNDWNVFKRDIPQTLPSCYIHYLDLCANKSITGKEVKLVLQAITSYFADRKGELTESENRAAINLNAWLTEWEKKLLHECVRITEEMECRVRSSDPWLTDYEIDLEVSFYLREDDPFSEENNPDADEYDIDSEAQLLCSTGFLMNGLIFAKDVTSTEYWGIGDGQDHKENSIRNDTIFYEKHCSTFHDLYSRLAVPMKHMGRIGRVYSDIKVYYQNGVLIDLKSEPPFESQDEPRVR